MGEGPIGQVYLLAWWSTLNVFNSHLGYEMSALVGAHLFLRLPEGDVQSVCGPFVRYSSQQHRALFWDRTLGAAPTPLVPFGLPSDQDRRRLGGVDDAGRGGGPMSDPLWDEYVDAVRNLGQLPALRDERRRQATAHEQASVRRAKDGAGDRATALRGVVDRRQPRDEYGRGQAGRRAGAGARRVGGAGAPVCGAPAELVGIVQQTERELAGDLIGVDTARRRAKQRAIERAQRAKELAARRRAVIKFAAVGGAVVVALLVLAVLLG